MHLENLVVVDLVVCQAGMDTEVDNFAEGNGTSKEGRMDMLGVVLALGVLDLGFVLRVRQQNPRSQSLVVSYKPWCQNEQSVGVHKG